MELLAPHCLETTRSESFKEASGGVAIGSQ